MKRRDLIRHLHNHHCVLLREGSGHSIYVNTRTRNWASIPRHQEIKETLARKICKQLGIPLP